MPAPAWYERLLAECPPKNHTVPDWDCEHTLRQAQRYFVIADLMGLALMPHQRLFLTILAMPRCYELVYVIGRQQGKTVSVLIPIIDVLLRLPRHNAIYSAQRGLDAQRKIQEEFWPLFNDGGLDETTGFKLNKGTSDFGIHCTNDARLRPISSEKEALRGATRVALGIIDEARADKDHNRSVLITPTMTVVKEAKLVVASTAGHVGSVYLGDRLAKARLSYNDPDSVVCLLEYGVGKPEADKTQEERDACEDIVEEYDPSDPELWKKHLPAIGYTTSVQAIRRAYETMEPHDYAMEYLGHWLPLDIGVAVPDGIWRQACHKELKLEGKLVMSIDAPPEQDRTAAVVSDTFGRIELLDIREGPETAYDWIVGVLERNKDIREVALANNNTLLRTGERLQIAGYAVRWYDTKEMHKAASRFWEAIHAEPQAVAIRYNPILNAANRGAFRWTLAGGGWVFMRQTEEEFCSPLIAATMAYNTAVRPGEQVSPGKKESYDEMWDRLTGGY